MPSEDPSQIYIASSNAVDRTSPASATHRARTPIRAMAAQIVGLGWVTEDRVEDVVVWLAPRWRPGLELTPELRMLMNEGLPPAVPDDQTPDERDWIGPVIAHVERATGLELPDRVRKIVGFGVVDAMTVMGTDRGHGKVISRGIVYARDERADNHGGLRALLAMHPGVAEHEAQRVSKLLIGTRALDRDAYPYRGERVGMSGALPSCVFGLPVTVKMALGWAHLVTRAVEPTINPIAMRRRVTRRIQARYRALPDQCLAPLTADRVPTTV